MYVLLFRCYAFACKVLMDCCLAMRKFISHDSHPFGAVGYRKVVCRRRQIIWYSMDA